MIFKTNTKVILLEHDARSFQDIQDLWKWQIIRIAVIFHTWWQISWCYNVIILQATSGISLDNRLGAAAQWSDNLIWRECSALISPVSVLSPQTCRHLVKLKGSAGCGVSLLVSFRLTTRPLSWQGYLGLASGHLIGSSHQFLIIQELARACMSGKLKT